MLREGIKMSDVKLINKDGTEYGFGENLGAEQAVPSGSSGSVCFLCKNHYDVELPPHCVLLCAECRKIAYSTADKFYERSKQNAQITCEKGAR